jgi:hypothetical protein
MEGAFYQRAQLATSANRFEWIAFSPRVTRVLIGMKLARHRTVLV